MSAADNVTPLPGAAAPIPRYVANLNELARSAGMVAETSFGPGERTPAPRLWTCWRGTRAQLLAVVQPVPSYRLPLSRGSLAIPGGARNLVCPLMEGEVAVDGDAVEFKVDHGPAYFALAEQGGVQITTWEDETAYHGAVVAQSYQANRVVDVNVILTERDRREAERVGDE